MQRAPSSSPVTFTAYEATRRRAGDLRAPRPTEGSRPRPGRRNARRGPGRPDTAVAVAGDLQGGVGHRESAPRDEAVHVRLLGAGEEPPFAPARFPVEHLDPDRALAEADVAKLPRPGVPAVRRHRRRQLSGSRRSAPRSTTSCATTGSRSAPRPPRSRARARRRANGSTLPQLSQTRWWWWSSPARHRLVAGDPVAEVDALEQALLDEAVEHAVDAREPDRRAARGERLVDLLRAAAALLLVEVLDHGRARRALPLARIAAGARALVRPARHAVDGNRSRQAITRIVIVSRC